MVAARLWPSPSRGARVESFTYTMSGWEPLVLAKTIGPLTIAILALGWVPALFGSRLRPIQ